MENPQFLYYLALGLMVLAETVRPGAFGKVLGGVAGVFLLSFAAYAYGMRQGWDIEAYDSYWMPSVQIGLRLAGFVFAIAVARNPVEHFTAALFVAMACVDALRLFDVLWAITWYRAIFFLSFAQLVTIAATADFHPIGRAVRTWAQRILSGLEMRAFAVWRHAWA